jgi:hypothetical protein
MLALLGLPSCATVSEPDFSVLEVPPTMSVEVVVEAVDQDGSLLSEFAWKCNDYSSYIERMRGR